MTSTAHQLQDQLLSGLSAERKLLLSEGLRHAAWELKAAWIRNQHPELTPREVTERVRQLFLHAGT